MFLFGLVLIVFFFFFFQAEDGIRDHCVTGVQTCALPISSTQRLLARGARLTELLKQPQYSPMPVEEQVASIFAGTQGFLDTVPVTDVVRYEAALLAFLRSEHPEILAKIRETKQLDDDTAAALKDALTAFGKQFA